MPKIFKEKENSDQKINQEKDISPEQLAAQESLLINNLEKGQKGLPEEEFQLLIDRIFEHSAADGLRYASQLGLDRSQVAHSISQPKFYLKHEKLANSILNEVNSNCEYIDHEDFSEFIKGNYDNYRWEFAEDTLNQDRLFKNQKRKYSFKTAELLKEIDGYYLNFLRLQNIKLENPENSIIGKDALIQEQLEASKLALTSNYYSGEILNILFKNLINEDGEKIKELAEKHFKNNSSLKDKYNNDFDRYYNSLIRGSVPNRDITLNYLGKDKEGKKIVDIFKSNNLIDQVALDTISKKYKLTDEIDKKKIESAKYKPLDLVYKTRKEMVKTQIIDDLKKSLLVRFNEEKKIVLDKESDTYIVEGLKKGGADEKEKVEIENKIIYQDPLGEKIVHVETVDNNFMIIKSHKGKKDEKFSLLDSAGKKIGDEYDNIKSRKNINNQLYFVVEKNNQEFVIGPDGQKIGDGYDGVVDLKNLNDKLYFTAFGNNKKIIIGPDGQEIGKDYDEIEFIDNLGSNQFYFRAQKDNKYFVLGLDGQKIVENFKKITFNINNQFYYTKFFEGDLAVIGPDGQIGDEYSHVDSFANINNQIYFRAKKYDKIFFIGPDGQKIGEDYDDYTTKLENINNQQYFIATKNNKEFAIGPDGQKIGGEYDKVRGRSKNINNQLYFVVQKNHEEFVIGPDGQKIGGEYEDVSSLYHEPYFIGFRYDKFFAISSDGQEISMNNYDNREGSLVSINDHLYFSAKILRHKFVSGPDGQVIGENYDGVYDLKNINNEIYFIAKKSDKYFIVGPDGQKISDDFEKNVNFYYSKEGKQLIVNGLKDNSLIQQKIKLIDSSEHLTDQEKKLLNLLNLINKPNLEGIDDFLKEPRKNNKNNNKLSDKEVFRLNETLNSDKSLLLETYPAKKDRSVAELSARFLYKIFPEVLENKKRVKDNKSSFWNRMGFSGGGGFGGGGSKGRESNGGSGESGNNVSRNRESADTYEGSGFSENGKEPEKVLSSKESIEGIMATNIFGKYENDKWQKIEFKIDNEANLPQKEITVTLHNVGNTLNMSLPKPLEGRIISERVKGIKADGKEINLDVQINALQEATCISSENVKEIVYSFKVSEVSEPLVDISNQEYDNYVSKLEYKKELTNNIAELPEDLQFLINSLKNKSPKEKITTIENYVKENSYYDFDNKETINLKKGKNITEIIDIMELRVQELNESGKIKTNKKYAGVCADFALLTTALLRQANIASGYLTGYGLNGEKTATTASAHGCSFVLYPDNKGKTRMISVDGTPASEGGKGGQEHFSEPSLEEKEKQTQEVKEEKEKDAFEELEKIEKIIASHSEEEINKLNNGKLEEVLNNILRYSVNQNNLETIETVLNAYWYSPLKDININSLDDNLKATSFIKQEMDNLKLKADKGGYNYKLGEAGSKLFNVSQDFIRRFAGRKSDSDSLSQGLKILEKVYDLSKNNLNEIERKTLLTIVRYLEAKNITGRK